MENKIKNLKYVYLVSEFKGKIQNGEIKPGEQFPSEKKLCEAYNVSRVTVRKALTELCKLGFAERINNRGFFAKSIQGQRIEGLRSLWDEIKLAGYTPSCKIISYSIEPANAIDAKRIGVDEGETILKFERLRYASGTPCGIEKHIFPKKFLNLDVSKIENESLIRVLQDDFHVNIAYTDQKIEAVTLSDKKANLLNTKKDRAFIKTKSLMYDVDGNLIKFTVTYLNTSIVGYSFVWYN